MTKESGTAAFQGVGASWSGLEAAAWLLLAVSTPLFVNFWGQQPFELPKVVLLRTLVWLLAAALAALLANLVHNLVSFDVTPTAMAFWLLMGVGVGLTGPAEGAHPAGRRNASFWRRVGGGLLLLVIAAACWQANGRPLLADIHARAAVRAAQSGAWPQAGGAADRAIAAWPVEPAHHLLRSRLSWQRALADPIGGARWFDPAEKSVLAARALRPADPALWRAVGDFYAAAAHHIVAETRPQGAAAYRQALVLAPNDASLYTAWGRLLLQVGDPAAAAPLLRRAVALDATAGSAYVHLGGAEFALGRVDVALDAYREAVRLRPDLGAAHAGLARAYWQLGRPEAAQAAVEASLALEPDNVEALAVAQALEAGPDHP